MTSASQGLLSPGHVETAATMSGRMRSVLPRGWFPEEDSTGTSTPVLKAVLAGIGAAWAFNFGQLQSLVSQTRIATATGGFLDAIASDFFGLTVQREQGEGDDPFRLRVMASMLPDCATRSSVAAALEVVAGPLIEILEPQRVADTGVILGLTGGGGASGGYGDAGLRYGSRSLPSTSLLNVYSASAVDLSQYNLRRTPATYVDTAQLLTVVGPNVIRPGNSGSALSEASGWNLIRDSMRCSGFTLPIGCSVQSTVSVPLLDEATYLAVLSPQAGTYIGPGVVTSVGSAGFCASAWVFVPSDDAVTGVVLECHDAGGQTLCRVEADLTRRNVWQRISCAGTGNGAGVGNCVVSLNCLTSAPAARPIMTQCWQVEPGQIVSSFIPTTKGPAWREADILVKTDANGAVTTPSLSSVSHVIMTSKPVALTCGVRILSS